MPPSLPAPTFKNARSLICTPELGDSKALDISLKNGERLKVSSKCSPQIHALHFCWHKKRCPLSLLSPKPFPLFRAHPAVLTVQLCLLWGLSLKFLPAIKSSFSKNSQVVLTATHLLFYKLKDLTHFCHRAVRHLRNR